MLAEGRESRVLEYREYHKIVPSIGPLMLSMIGGLDLWWSTDIKKIARIKFLDSIICQPCERVIVQTPTSHRSMHIFTSFVVYKVARHKNHSCTTRDCASRVVHGYTRPFVCPHRVRSTTRRGNIWTDVKPCNLKRNFLTMSKILHTHTPPRNQNQKK